MDSLPKNIRQLLTWLLVCPAQEPMSRRQKAISILLILTIISVPICGLPIGLATILKYKSNELEKSLNTIFEAIALSSAVYIIVITFYQRKKITSMFDHLSEIYSSSEFKITYNIYICIHAEKCFEMF